MSLAPAGTDPKNDDLSAVEKRDKGLWIARRNSGWIRVNNIFLNDPYELGTLIANIKSHERITVMGKELLQELLNIHYGDIQERIDIVTRVLGELSGDEHYDTGDLKKIRGYLGLLSGTDYEEFRMNIVNQIEPVTKLFRYKYDPDALNAPQPSQAQVDQFVNESLKMFGIEK